jgi:6-phosphogluconolactonase (cycloisomerase 2 family)
LAGVSLHMNTVRFSASPIGEWLANRPSGLEQGFTLPRRPAGRGELAISQAISGNARGRVDAAAQSVTFTYRDGVLRYEGLTVTDASGHRVPARLSISDRRLTITVADRDAVYPLRVDPVMVTPVTQSPASNADTGMGPYSVAFSPAGGLVATANYGSETVSAFKVNESTGALTPVVQTPASNADTGAAPSSIAFSPNGDLLAVANDNVAGSVSLYTVNSSTGALTPVTQSSPSDAETGPDPVALAFSPGGGLLAAVDSAGCGLGAPPSCDASGTVSLFKVNDSTGALTPVTQTPASNADTGEFPDGLSFSPGGGLLATTNAFADTVRVFTVNDSTGAVTPVTQTPASNAETLSGNATAGTGTGTGTSGSGSNTGSTGAGTSGGGGATNTSGTTSGAGVSTASIAALATQLGLPSAKACLSQRKITIHVAEHVRQVSGTSEIKSAEVLLAGRVVAKLKGTSLVAHVSLVGLRKGSFKITVKATTTAGKTLVASSTFHTCVKSKRKRKKGS